MHEASTHSSLADRFRFRYNITNERAYRAERALALNYEIVAQSLDIQFCSKIRDFGYTCDVINLRPAESD